ncbi:MAG: hypothetical protein IKS87_08660 [Lachnospiraceae bacterium]|nr:hypothetical protein [Lachnospiraceae bacterium]
MKKIRLLLCMLLTLAMSLSALQPASATILKDEPVEFDLVVEEDKAGDFDKDTWDLGGHHDDGNLIAQSEKYVFFNDPELMGLVAYDKKSRKKIQLTNFPTANLTVKGDSIFLTDTAGTIAVETDDADPDAGVVSTSYGGALYRIDGIDDLNGDFSVHKIGEEGSCYYNLQVDESGFYATKLADGAPASAYVSLSDDGAQTGSLIPDDGSFITKSFTIDGYLFLECYDESGSSRIYCIDKNNGSGRRWMYDGSCMHLVSDAMIFVSNADSFVYAVEPGNQEAYVISYFPVSALSIWYDYIICADGLGNAHSINFAINRWSCDSPYESTFFVPVNSWMNMCEVFPFAIDSDGPDPDDITPKKQDDKKPPQLGGNKPGQKLSGRVKRPQVHYGPKRNLKKPTPLPDVPEEVDRPNPNDALREVQDYLYYIRNDSFPENAYNDTPELQQEFREMYWGGKSRTQYLGDKVDDMFNRAFSGVSYSSEVKEALCSRVRRLLEEFYRNAVLDAYLSNDVGDYASVFTYSSDFLVIHPSTTVDRGKLNDEGYDWLLKDTEHLQEQAGTQLKLTYNRATKHWRIQPSDARWFFEALIRDDDGDERMVAPGQDGGADPGNGGKDPGDGDGKNKEEPNDTAHLWYYTDKGEQEYPDNKVKADYYAYAHLCYNRNEQQIKNAFLNDKTLNGTLQFLTKDERDGVIHYATEEYRKESERYEKEMERLNDPKYPTDEDGIVLTKEEAKQKKEEAEKLHKEKSDALDYIITRFADYGAETAPQRFGSFLLNYRYRVQDFSDALRSVFSSKDYHQERLAEREKNREAGMRLVLDYIYKKIDERPHE